MTLSSAYLPTSKHPVSRALHGLLYAQKIAKKTGKARDPVSSDVVSESLCDDVLKLLAPSLVAYEGCDIIDLHPGPCLWTQKLHAVLKPRRHLLMEPDPIFFEPFIKPLLDESGSAYRYTTISGAHPKSYWSAYNNIFNDKLLPKRPNRSEHDQRLRLPDTRLLVTGNLHRPYPGHRAAQNAVSSPVMILNHMIQAAQTNTMFHTLGLVRMLFWVPGTVRDQVYPASLSGKSPFNCPIDMSAELVEVTGPPQQVQVNRHPLQRSSRRDRPLRLERQSMSLALARQEAAGLTTPATRRNPMLNDLLGASPVLTIKTGADPSADLDFSSLLRRCSAFASNVKTYMSELSSRRAPRPGFLNNAEVIANNKAISGHFTYKLPPEFAKDLSPFMIENIEPFAELTHRQVGMEADICRAGLAKDDYMKLEAILLDTSQILRDCHTKLSARHYIKPLLDLLEEERGISYEQAIIPRDRRPYEPLVATEDEFWPRIPLHLLDITPRSHTLASDITSAAEGNTVMRSVAQTLMMRDREDIAKSLERIGPNASRDLIASTPILRDASKGGRLDPRDLSVRMLTPELFAALTTSYLEWPFRPDEPGDLPSYDAAPEQLTDSSGAEETANEEQGPSEKL